MANVAENKGIVNSWSLVAFRSKFAKMKVTNEMTNKETGDTFKSCAFIAANGDVLFVNFSSHLGELTPREIAAMRDELQVVELESGTFKLCKQGADSWEDVDI
jgi:hypothetical protein